MNQAILMDRLIIFYFITFIFTLELQFSARQQVPKLND